MTINDTKNILLRSCSAEEFDSHRVQSLNLYNFENRDAFHHPYILTSARSLKACRLASIKPIELLRRSVEEIANDLNLSVENANQIYIDYEQERLRKLEVCRLIRKHLLTAEIQNQKSLGTNKSFKTYLNKQKYDRSFSYSSRGSTPELHLCLQRSSSYSPSSPIHSTVHTLRKPTSTYKICKSPTRRKNLVSSLDSKYDKSGRRIKFNEISNDHVASSSTELRQTSSASKQSNRKSRVNNSKDTSVSCCPQVPALKHNRSDQQLCWQDDKMKESDRNCSTNKLQTRRRAIEFSLKENKFKINGEAGINPNSNSVSQKHRKLNSKKNSPESLENKLSQKLDKGIHVKTQIDKFNHNVKNKTSIELPSTSAKNVEINPDLMSGIKNHDMRILDAMFLNREKQHLEKEFARKADLFWETCQTSPKKADNTLTCNKSLRSCYPQVCTCNENVAFNTCLQQIKNKMKLLKEDSLNKELHSEQVRQLARELQAGMEQWQDHVLLIQWRAVQRAKINAKLNLESKRLKAQSENNERTLLHALRLRNIHGMERIKQQIMKKEIEEKDCRIERIKMKKQQEILDCKVQAQYTAELRDQLRKTLTPETFDMKVNDAMIKSKFINRSLTASPFIESSHIRLG